MTIGSELKFVHERAGLSTEMDDGLDAFAAERDLTAPPVLRHATQAPLVRDIPLTLHPPDAPLAPVRPARARVRLTLMGLVLVGTAGWAAYLYQSNRLRELDVITMSQHRPARPSDIATPAEATASREAPPSDLPLASSESAVAPTTDRKVDAEQSKSIAASRSLPAAVQNVSGEWRLTAQVETSDSSLEDLKLHYEMELEQDGDRVAGVGTKVSENENGTGSSVRTPVTVTGTIAGDRLTLDFVERGTQRDTRGKFVLLIEEAGTLRGRFSSNAAQSSRHVEAHRVSSAQ